MTWLCKCSNQQMTGTPWVYESWTSCYQTFILFTKLSGKEKRSKLNLKHTQSLGTSKQYGAIIWHFIKNCRFTLTGKIGQHMIGNIWHRKSIFTQRKRQETRWKHKGKISHQMKHYLGPPLFGIYNKALCMWNAHKFC